MTGLARWSAFLREQVLRRLFPVVLAWASFVPLIPVYDGVLSLNPYPEGGSLHNFFEQDQKGDRLTAVQNNRTGVFLPALVLGLRRLLPWFRIEVGGLLSNSDPEERQLLRLGFNKWNLEGRI